MKKSRKARIFFRILFCFFLVYVALIIAYESGYYETKSSERAILTKEAMERFEQDLSKGQLVDVKDYLVEDRKDYSNKVTKVGNKISQGISDFMTKGLSRVFEALKGLFW